MIRALKEHIVPVLRMRGFKGSFPHFRRPTEPAIQLLKFQFDKRGGGFVVEIAICPLSGVTFPNGKHVAPTELTTGHAQPQRRFRLGTTEAKTDHWFRFDQKGLIPLRDPYEKAARAVLPYLHEQAEPWWNRAEAR
jgi:hypothetical protein